MIKNRCKSRNNPTVAAFLLPMVYTNIYTNIYTN